MIRSMGRPRPQGLTAAQCYGRSNTVVILLAIYSNSNHYMYGIHACMHARTRYYYDTVMYYSTVLVPYYITLRTTVYQHIYLSYSGSLCRRLEQHLGGSAQGAQVSDCRYWRQRPRRPSLPLSLRLWNLLRLYPYWYTTSTGNESLCY